MTIENFIKNALIPLISVLTAVMVAVLNWSVNEKDQKLQERLNNIDMMVKENKETRDERESNQGYNLKIYKLVTDSLEAQSAHKQEAAKAFVLVMVEEPLRSSLLNVLKEGGAPEVQQNISRILLEEEKFQSKAAFLPIKERDEVSSYQWDTWDFDIFWCTDSGAVAKTQAELIGEQLLAEDAKGRVRIRELPKSLNAKAGFQINGYGIRRNNEEEKVAKALKNLAEKTLDKNGTKTTFNVSISPQNTQWYVSAYVCPGN